MKTVKYFLSYCWSLVAGGIALLLIYFYDGALILPDWYTKGSLRMVFGFSWCDWYFLVNLVLILPIVRVFMRHAYRQDSVEFETYKDKALRLHHEDAQANHKNRAWSANGVTANPWEYQYSQTQSYKSASDFGFNITKNLLLNILTIAFGPILLVYELIKNRQTKSL